MFDIYNELVRFVNSCGFPITNNARFAAQEQVEALFMTNPTLAMEVMYGTPLTYPVEIPSPLDAVDSFATPDAIIESYNCYICGRVSNWSRYGLCSKCSSPTKALDI
ncbi:hypothetical protein LCGC14_0345940 [marine sediment metagenome]|uniref:Uncharacterized protein n=1 Tax=marine sediment metagenome TaxID=412755 RepID=A0A0F9TV57_9ZZZZ